MTRLSVLLAGTALFAVSAAAGDATVAVPPGGQRIVGFEKPVATLYIADPSVIDAKALDKQHVSIIAKGHGSTSILAADANGVTIAVGRVVVGEAVRRGGGNGLSVAAVTLQRGSERVTYACAEHCAVTQRSGGSADRGGAAPQGASASAPVQQITITTPVPTVAAPFAKSGQALK